MGRFFESEAGFGDGDFNGFVEDIAIDFGDGSGDFSGAHFGREGDGDFMSDEMINGIAVISRHDVLRVSEQCVSSCGRYVS